jgi:hypothetical protein
LSCLEVLDECLHLAGGMKRGWMHEGSDQSVKRAGVETTEAKGNAIVG